MIGQSHQKVKYFKLLVFCKGSFQGGKLFTDLQMGVQQVTIARDYLTEAKTISLGSRTSLNSLFTFIL